MNLASIIEFYQKDKRTKQIVEHLQKKQQAHLHLRGLQASLPAFVATALYKNLPQNYLFILDNKENAAYFQNDLKNLLGKKDVLFFPDSFKKPAQFDHISNNNLLMRAETATKLLNSQTKGEILVSYPEALFEKIVNAKALNESTIHIKINEQLDADFIVDMLVEYGFRHTDFVYEPGYFSIRGGIIDVFSFGNDMPYRIELFDDEVESIRVFDPLSQLSEKKVQQVSIIPDIQTQFEHQQKTSIFQLLPENTVIWTKDLNTLLRINQACYEKVTRLLENLQHQNLLEENEVFAKYSVEQFINSEDLFKDMQLFSLVEFGEKTLLEGIEIAYNTSFQPLFNKNFQLLSQNLKENTKKGLLNFIFADTARQVNRFQQIFDDMEKEPPHYHALTSTVHQGFIDYDLKIACYTDHQIFDRFYKYQLKRNFVSKDKVMTVRMLRELQNGDFVTHIDHGIGIYSGLEKIKVNDKLQEVMRIVYRNKDILYVNINSLHKVSKYVGKDGTKPKINRLGSDAWQAVKRKTKNKIKDIAEDLIKLYAKRKAAKGFAFAKDTYLQAEIEASFIYEDTPDQLKAAEAVKEDMESEHPMDRLVCGDVGFGKTEIAVRAAAKAVADGKQVAVLVPTTILALQHHKTFKERFKNFPCEIDFLNRFKTAKQKKETLKNLAEGKLDIIIGTHALVGKSVEFKDLGLLIIDEEQKFGVATKEKLRNIKINVDTLTLTATPIPRTLQFSLMSARDMSIIATPPPNRRPVQTELMTFSEEKIRKAINYEIYRGGQVFFIHNRIKDLVELANMIKRLCPNIDVGIANGQMPNNMLEERMLKFIKAEYDVLVCTNIVESGLDIANANTIIINNAQNYGLSDLHQLRGRVGRSNRKAFCYLISPPIHVLPDDSRKRLKAIEQYSNLGDGWQVAMKDLNIRGAGNILGGEQSGFIADIGFNIYHKILDEAVQELKETSFKEVFKEQIIKDKTYVKDCQIDTDQELLIPDSYVNSINERLRLYTELDSLKDETALQNFGKVLEDRFGALPKPVKDLFYTVRLRWLAKKLGFERILFKNGKLRCYFISNQDSAFYQSPLFMQILQYTQTHSKQAHFKQTDKYLLMIFENIKNMKEAHAVLQKVEEYVNENN